MALEIQATESAQLTLTGTSDTLSSCYSRVSCIMSEDGKTMNTRLFNYGVKQNYLDGDSPAKIVELKDKYKLDVDIQAGEEQSVRLANEKMKALLETDGYAVTIVDMPA